MKTSVSAHNSPGDIAGRVAELQLLEEAGADVIWVAETYSFDAASALGYLVACTERATIASGILNFYSRTPALLAMTAAGLDALSKRRLLLGLEISGPQVIEGFHGLLHAAPLMRLREAMENCREVWRREYKLTYAGRSLTLPLRARGPGSANGCEPWQALAVKLMLKWPNLYQSTSAFAPKRYPKAVVDYAKSRGANKIIYAGYLPMGLPLERIMRNMPAVSFKPEVWPKSLRENAARIFKID